MHSDNISQSTLGSSNHTLLLQLVNDEIATTLIPAMVIIGLLMISGFIGNILVIYVFSTKLRKSTQNYLFVTLAVFDLMSCCVAMPTEIIDMRFFYTFHSEPACKILRFLVGLPTFSANVILLTIAIDRFRKVCRPLDPQLTKRTCRISVAIATIVGIVGALPALIVYGNRSALTRIAGVLGTDCSTSDAMKGTIYPLLYEIGLAATFLVFTTSLIILYLMIWREIKRHKIYMKKHTNYGMTNLSSTEKKSGESDHVTTPLATRARSLSKDTTTASTTVRPVVVKRQRTTVIAFLVTFVFILSFVPHLGLIIARSVIKDFDHHLVGSKLVLYNVFIRSYFVNSVANPIIYGAMNFNFRIETIKVFKKLWCV